MSPTGDQWNNPYKTFPLQGNPLPAPVWIDPTPTLIRIADILERIAAALEAKAEL